MKPHFSKGSADKFAFVFSCPGREEEVAGHPTAGTTGRNFEALLQFLSPHFGGAALTRGDVTITNAWSQIEYKARTGRSEATDSEVKGVSNINRLASELRHVNEMVVFCGDKAKVALTELEQRNLLPRPIKVAYAEHLGTRGLNSIKFDIENRPIVSAKNQKLSGCRKSLRVIKAENTARRLEVVTKCLLSGLRRIE